MKKIKKLIQTSLFFTVFTVIGFFIGLRKEFFKTETFIDIFNIVFNRNLDFLIIGFVVLFIFSTGVIQNFIFREFKLKLNINNDFFIYLFFVPVMISFFRDGFFSLKIFSFLKPLSSRPDLYIFCLSFVLIFTFLYLFFLIVCLMARAPFFKYCILNSMFVALSISLFLSFFTILFWKIMMNSSSMEEKFYIISSFVLFLLSLMLGDVFKKEEIKSEND